VNNTLIIALGIMGAALIGAFVAIILFYDGDKAIAIAGLTAVAGLIVPQLLSLKASSDNAVKLEKVDKKIEENTATTNETHTLVNSRVTQLIETVKQLSEVQQELVAAQSLAAGITEGRAQAIQDATPNGGTPPHGTPVKGTP
jgi:hypothetical protein